ncbi:MAG: AraC family transcriptional regulator [Candidatus Pedobacter colombiensis]|uniref:AraC family transcriptional regulator n=1 Tax=Candidatus Pedobacter colombiensis TaxID=3121371 RepID=A0AAJ5WAH7_9SPHI|nr:AraC family transcriptional regulator [Pedobacter sp.]WEK20919.1 MAG: AraC family transcriptional regulator [Pedobacter sp.]
MQSHLILNLVTAATEFITSSHLPHFCSWPIQYALAKLITLPEGKILRQSFSHYLVHIDLFEYVLTKETSIDFVQAEMSIFMFAIFEGYSSFYDQQENFISDVKSGSCHFGYNDKGNYRAALNPGVHKFLVLNFRPEWFLHEAKNLCQFKTLIANYKAKHQAVFTLPDCPLAKHIRQSIKKMLFQNKTKKDDPRIVINGVLSQLIRQYHQMLVDNHYTTAALHQTKATDIANFIRNNFRDQVVDCISEMAKHFGVKTFHRLVKIAFGIPLREQVIALRMEYGLHQLKTTQKTINEIAFEAGYNDPHYFSRAFKKHYKVNPGSLRGLNI